VLTSSYHLKRERCCGKGCVHCPYNYENVPEPKRTRLLKERPPVVLMEKRNGERRMTNDDRRLTTDE